ncbi:type I restriction-modification system restriction subunit domain protein [Mycobacterium ulcerans str. Harvey]|uniref:Type I restriction-modification system restriction subunit domain protein n=1 Tax=Mycobacterium ulcerans str. Harvey TaxID=1299332 RepID=A0ABN0R9K7_MYCUL|nr:type I restriction-modification system restriction subunit domain protein [Mycobacterium ulcerans str. Harvey]
MDEALERIRALVEPVAPPKNTLQYQQYFCAIEPGTPSNSKTTSQSALSYTRRRRSYTCIRQPRQRYERRRIQRCRSRGDQNGD